MQSELTTEQLIELYKVAIEEYRFQVKLNNDRLLHLTVFNIAVLSAGAGLLRVGGSWLGNMLVATIFIAGFCTSLIGARAVRTFHRYYRRTVHRRTVYEDLLGLAQTRELPSGGRGDLAIGTTNSHEERLKILTQTDEWIQRPLGVLSVVGGFRLTLSILAVLHVLGAAAAIALALGFKPNS
jgi:hypothetical protein